jgi:putative CocE/NonD family hydrolase
MFRAKIRGLISMNSRHSFLLLAVFAATADAQVADLSQGSDIPEQFPATTDAYDHTRTEVMIPMRDGVKLHTVIMTPKGVAGPMPIVITRTPYNANRRSAGREGASPLMALSVRAVADFEPMVRNGYILVFQDVRGKHGSEGRYIMNLPPRGPLNRGGTDHATDTWDTVDWLVKNVEGNNGNVAITGCSYDGFLALMALFDPHPALKASIPVNAMVDTWIGDDSYHHGAFRQQGAEWFYAQMSTKGDTLSLPYGYRDLYRAFLDAGSASDFAGKFHIDRLPAWQRTIDNPAYTAFWREQAVHELLKKVKVRIPVLTVHGLFDAEDIFGPIASYAAMEEDDAANDRNSLVIGPWFHGQTERFDGASLGEVEWDSNTARHYREKIRQPFLDRHLKGKAPARPLAPVTAFETGSNEWREYDAWPPKAATSRLYLHAQGRADFRQPADEGYTEYVSDPAKPVPYRPRPILSSYADWEVWLTGDQRHVADRTDVVNFTSDALTEPLTVSGQAIVNLVASTTGTDADWVVKLIDQYPEEDAARPAMAGFQLMVAADVLRGRYRETREEGRPIPAGKALPYRFPLPHSNHTFLPGHRIVVQVQSSWFPLYDRNPQRFVANIAYAKSDDYQKATHRIHHGARAESFLELPVRRP